MSDATITEVRNFFKTGNAKLDALKVFRDEWEKLSLEERGAIREGIGNGTYNY